MAAYSFDFNSNFSSGNCFSGLVDPFSRDLGPYDGISHGGSLSVPPVPHSQSTLVLDSEKSELVKTPAKAGKKSVSEEKLMSAMKSHSEAERRRRERINAHLNTLRTLVPCRQKMDKATLLGEVIKQVKQLRKNAIEASNGFLVPMDDDDVRVVDDDRTNGTYCFKASICCDYRPELLTDLRKALDGLPIKIVKSEISTLGNRLRNDFVFVGCQSTPNADDVEARKYLARSVHKALNSVLEKASMSSEYLPCSTFPKKRQRLSYFDSSSSSS